MSEHYVENPLFPGRWIPRPDVPKMAHKIRSSQVTIATLRRATEAEIQSFLMIEIERQGGPRREIVKRLIGRLKKLEGRELMRQCLKKK